MNVDQSEADYAAVEKRKKEPSWWARHWLKVCLIGLFAWTSLGFFLGANERTARIDQVTEFSHELRDGLVKSCAENGNPLRIAVQGILREEIQQSQAADLERFFPQIDPAELQKLIAEANERRRKRIREIQPVNCSKQYPTENEP